MDDRNPVESSEEPKVSQNDNDGTVPLDSQDQSQESSGNIATLGNQVLPFVGQGVSESQRSPTNLQFQECKTALETPIVLSVPMDTFTNPNQSLVRRRKKISAKWYVEPLEPMRKLPRFLDGILQPVPSSSDPNPASSSQNTLAEDGESCAKSKTQQVSSFSAEDTQSDSNSVIETEMLQSSQSRIMKENITAFLHEDLTDQKRTESSTRTSEPNEKSLSELKGSPTSKTPEAVRKSKEALTSGNLHDTQEKLNRAIRNESPTSEKRSQLDTDVDTLDTVVAKLQDALNNNEPQVKDGSSASDPTDSSSDKVKYELPPVQFGSSDGDQTNSSSGYNLFPKGPPIPSNSSSDRLSKHALDARMILLAVLHEIMELNGEEDRWSGIQDMFLVISESSCLLTEMRLRAELFRYLHQRLTAENVQRLFVSPETELECGTQEGYAVLTQRVVKTLWRLVTKKLSLDFDGIIEDYGLFRDLYDISSLLWMDSKVEDVPEAAHQNRLETLKEKLPMLLLLTKNAFQMLLMHVGEQAERGKLDEYEVQLSEEDKKYLRRKI